MIKVNRSSQAPEVLRNNATNWKQEVLQHINNGGNLPKTLRNKYNSSEVKTKLKEDANQKCMYCESRPLDSSWGEIEHIKPKSKYPELIFEWENLGFTCSVCNNSKGDEYDEDCPPINPYEEDPSDFILAHGPMLLEQPNNDRGRLTVDLLKLNRQELIGSRIEKVKEINNWIQLIARMPSKQKKIFFTRELMKYAGEEAEFSFIAKDLVEKLKELLDLETIN